MRVYVYVRLYLYVRLYVYRYVCVCVGVGGGRAGVHPCVYKLLGMADLISVLPIFTIVYGAKNSRSV